MKDYVKSEKHHWKNACFIPNASDTDQAFEVAKNFLKLRGPDLEGGLVFRKFMQFRKLGLHPKSGMPLTEEFRAFVLDGKIICVINYWEEIDYPESPPNIAMLLPMVASIPSRFFTVDFARLENGDWMVVELGDGQVAGLPETANVRAFYRALLTSNIECQTETTDSRTNPDV